MHIVFFAIQRFSFTEPPPKGIVGVTPDIATGGKATDKLVLGVPQIAPLFRAIAVLM
ncbi:hypothetical protein [Providencia stuartii]|nr:hypothetical protein BML2537_15240 [Providencia stuartii]CAK6614424.1 Transposase [Providencia stuartii]CAK6615671.1 Transposase [Providencia stuartii]